MCFFNEYNTEFMSDYSSDSLKLTNFIICNKLWWTLLHMTLLVIASEKTALLSCGIDVFNLHFLSGILRTEACL